MSAEFPDPPRDPGAASPAEERLLPPCPAAPPVQPRLTPRDEPPPPSATATPGEAGPWVQPVEEERDSPRVPMVGKMALDAILEELGQALPQCRQLYLATVPPSEGFLKTASRPFAQHQDQLHRGLLAKIYATIATADGRWTYEEQRCAAVLLQHLGLTCAPADLERTARQLARQAGPLDWQRLLQPFQAIPELRDRLAELQTLVTRVANLIAKADGYVTPREAAALHAIQEEFHTDRRGAAGEGSPPLAAEPAGAPGAVPAPWDAAGKQHRPRRTKLDPAQLREERLQQLETLVGLRPIKQELAALADWVLFQHQRRQAELPDEVPDLQFIFLGPTGTGKTVVARLLSELLFASGGLKHGQLIEASGFDLIAGDARQAANTMKAVVAQAVGGTLLIKDAGALLVTGEASATNARNILRKNLAAHAGRLAVVLAADHADRLLPLLDQQPDLARLFRRRWQFTDYSTSELGQIFQARCDRSRYQVTRLAQIKLLLGFHWCVRQDRERFGNGRGVQRVFERAVHHLARRIAGLSPLTPELLTTFQDSDITIEGVPAPALDNLPDPQRRFSITCPGCANVYRVGKDLLGAYVECRSCHHRFVSAWGEPVD